MGCGCCAREGKEWSGNGEQHGKVGERFAEGRHAGSLEVPNLSKPEKTKNIRHQED